jgi:ribosomal protein L40E
MADPALEIGIVCGRCDTFSPMGAEQCHACGSSLRLFEGSAKRTGPQAALPQISPVPMTAPALKDELPDSSTLVYLDESDSQGREIDRVSVDMGSVPTELAQEESEESMDQAKNYVCESCMTPVPSGHKFCGRCGTPVPEHIMKLQTDYFSDMQDAEKARVVLIRGEDMEGLSYHLKADEHIVGRGGALDFSDDPFVSPKHANFFYRSGKLVVRDEGSVNGIYFRVRGGVEIAPGDMFLAGEQVFRLDPTPKASDANDTDGTFFYSSPKYPSPFRLNQILEGGAVGMTVCARGSTLVIGREDGDLNFPGDVYMSAKHCTIEEKDGKFVLTDHDSRNGTYLRLKTEKPLSHGDFLFIGHKLLRVEMNSN